MIPRYQDDRRFSDRFLGKVKAIISQVAIREASEREDGKEATDLITLDVRPLRFGVRVRRYSKEIYSKYHHEVTFRVYRETGTESEITKIIDGWGDFFFYGWGEDSGELLDFVVLDLRRLRAFLCRYAEKLNRLFTFRTNPSDGTRFLVLDLRRIPRETVILSRKDRSNLWEKKRR